MRPSGLRAAIAALAAVGLAIAGYLTWVHYTGIEPLCTGISDCERVQSSEYAELAGIPVALLGAIGYAAILASVFVRGHGAALTRAFLAYVGTAFSAYLTWAELDRIEAICQWCVASALVMLALAVLATLDVGRSDAPAST